MTPGSSVQYENRSVRCISYTDCHEGITSGKLSKSRTVSGLINHPSRTSPERRLAEFKVPPAENLCTIHRYQSKHNLAYLPAVLLHRTRRVEARRRRHKATRFMHAKMIVIRVFGSPAWPGQWGVVSV
ncbi:hypothetical protein ASPCAL01075 [Aspergillus calidoustus]|uniref:Uncharacterized protein n=1 Tax=Aspergillus calidoustus TaxID=454130 RepID=A0A0U4YWY1_ASPCI|nr:hypothetical protein ASPCAL01075 [Aspergillus calidoustus]